MSDDPVWDGDGKDPWLPVRLDRRIEAGDAEREVRRAFWSALSSWLVPTARRVLRGRRPDPEEVWAQAPAWTREVEKITNETIRPLFSRAYESLLGEGFNFEQRPFVTSYLGEVHNRMVGVPEEVFDLVAGQIAEGVNQGETIPELSRRVERELSTTATPRWQNRAVVTARTETIGALNGSRADAFRAVVEQTGDEMEKMWLSTTDGRTRESHILADGQRVPVNQPFQLEGGEVDYPGDPFGPPEEVIQCRCTHLLVRPGENTDMSNRQFLG